MKTILTIMKKEFARIFKDKRLVLSLILPGVLIYCIYSLLGSLIGNMFTPGADQTYHIAVIDLPAEIRADFEGVPALTYEEITANELESAKQRVTNGEIDAVADFSAYTATAGGTAGANGSSVAIYFNSTETNSSAAQSIVYAIVSARQTTNFTIAAQDIASDKDVSSMMLSMIAPMLLVTFIYAGCMSLVPESIAGEKERGSFATMLVTPVKRSHIALGKILSLSAASLISAACSFAGIVLSLPKLFQSEGSGLNFSAASYGVSDYLLLLFVIIATTLVIVALMSLLSTLAKSVKEANSYVGPLMIIILLAAMSNMLFGDKIGSWAYFVPILNSVKAMSEIFSSAAKTWQVLAASLTNFAAAGALSFALAKMFDSEKIISGS